MRASMPRLGARRSRLGARREHGSPVSGDPGSAREGRPTGTVHHERRLADGGVYMMSNPAGSREVKHLWGRPAPTVPPSITAVLAAGPSVQNRT